MRTAQLDFAGDDALTGFRLHRLEVYNWGTFGDHVWRDFTCRHAESASEDHRIDDDGMQSCRRGRLPLHFLRIHS